MFIETDWFIGALAEKIAADIFVNSGVGYTVPLDSWIRILGEQ
jgi:hypothetical protein